MGPSGIYLEIHPWNIALVCSIDLLCIGSILFMALLGDPVSFLVMKVTLYCKFCIAFVLVAN